MKKVFLDSISQVLAAIILSVLGFIGLFIYGQITDKEFKTVFNDVFTFSVPLYAVLLIIIGFILFTSLIGFIRTLIEPSDVKYLRKKIKYFTSDNYKYTFPDVGILCRYSVNYSNYTGKPFIHNLKIYCDLHTPPIEIFDGNCNVRNCSNGNRDISEYKIQTFLESDIIHKWEEYDKQNK